MKKVLILFLLLLLTINVKAEDNILYWEVINDGENVTLVISNYNNENNLRASFDSTIDFTHMNTPWNNYLDNINKIEVGNPNDIIKPTTTAYWFSDLQKVEEIELPYLDTSNVVNMEHMFGGTSTTNTKKIDVSNFNTEKVTNMSHMFSSAGYRITNLDLSSFDTSNVTNMDSMFSDLTALKSINFGNNFNTSKVTNMNSLFLNTNISQIDLSNFDTSSVTTMSYMFRECKNLETLDLKSFDTSKVTDMYGMFMKSNIRAIAVSNKWNTNLVNNTQDIFSDAHYIMGMNGTFYNKNNTNVQYAKIDEENSPGYFWNYIPENSYYWAIDSLDDSKYKLTISNNNISGTHIKYGMFKGFSTPWSNYSSRITSVQIGGPNDIIIPYNTSNWFENLINVYLLDLRYLDTSNVLSMDKMFYSESLPKLRIIVVSNKWNLEKVKSSNLMFESNKELIGMYGTKYDSSYIDKTYAKIDEENSPGYFWNQVPSIFHWAVDGINCTTTSDNCKLIISNNEIAGNHLDFGTFDFFDTSNGRNTWDKYINGIKDVQVGGPNDIIKPLSTSYWFYLLRNVESIDLSYLDTSNTLTMTSMFEICNSLAIIKVSDKFLVNNVVKSNNMFKSCSNLIGMNGTKYSSNNIDKTYAKVDTENTPGYFWDNISVLNISLKEKEITLFKDNTSELEYTIYPEISDDKSVTFSSSNTNVVTVDSNGKIKALGRGNATITVTTSNGKTDTCIVTVKDPKILSITIDEEEYNKNIDDKSFDINYNIEVQDDLEYTVKFTSDDNTIVTVNDLGKVTIVGEGKTSIKLKVNEIEKTIFINVDASIRDVKLNKNSITLNKSEEETLLATINPENTTNSKILNWESSNTNVATVDSNGKIKAVGRGNATITVTTSNGKTDTCVVTVKDPKILSITIDEEEYNKNIDDNSFDINYNVEVQDDLEYTVEFLSKNTDVVTIDSSGKVTIVGPGSTQIILRVNIIEKVITINVNYDIKTISLNKNNITLTINEEETLLATINPENTTNSKILNWESSNTNVATVDSNGKIKAVGRGNAIITVTTSNGKKDTCAVTVKDPKILSITIDEEEYNKNIDDNSFDINYNIVVQDDLEYTVEFLSKNTDVVTIDNSGKVTIVGPGSTQIILRVNSIEKLIGINIISNIKDVDLNKNNITLTINDEETLLATINPTNTTDLKTLTWTVGNPDVAIVDSNGKVKAVGRGTTTVTVTTSNGKSRTCIVNVKEPKLLSFDLEKEKYVINLDDKSFVINYNIEVQDDLEYKVEFISENPNVSSVDSNGKVTLIKPGQTVIKVKVLGIERDVIVKTYKDIDRISFDKDKIEMSLGEKTKLIPIVEEQAFIENDILNWSSSNTNVATVNQTGEISALSNGTTVIMVMYPNGIYANCIVEVKSNLIQPKISINKVDNNLLILNWDNQEYVTKYEVSYSTDKKKWTKKEVTTNSYVAKSLTYNKLYYFRLRAFDGTKWTSYSNIVSKKVVPNKVTNLKLTAGTNNVKVSFDKVNTTGYEIYMNGKKVTTITKNSTLTYNKTKLKANTTYKFKVRAYKTVSGKKVYGAFSSEVSIKTAPSKPKVSLSLKSLSEMNIKITSVKGASLYKVEKSLDGKAYESLENLPSTGTLAASDLEIGKIYYFRVRACNSQSRCSGWVTKSLKQTTKTPSISLKTSSKKVIVTVKSVDGADGYEVVRATSKKGKYTNVKSLTSSDELAFNNGTKKGKKYYYKVRSYKIVDGKRVYSSYSGIKSIKSK